MSAKTKAPARPAAQSAELVARMIAEIGTINRELEARKRDADEQLARIAEAIETARAPLVAERDALAAAVQTWCEANRSTLTGDGRRKSADFATGRVSWRVRPPKVSVRGVPAVIEALIARGLDRFLRRKVEIDKEAILKDPGAVAEIAGVSVSSAGEEFIIDPAELKESTT